MALTTPAVSAAPAAARPAGQENALRRLHELGQSIWLDFISRELITSGELDRLIDLGLLGMTSNPTIFEKAIAGSTAYDAQLAALARQGLAPQAIFEALAVQDIQDAADRLRPVYDRLDGADGFVSLEVSPALAYATAATVAEVERLWREVSRPNVMIKIPATLEGLPAIARSIARGINVNVTLLFDVDRYEAVVNAYFEGLEERVAAGQPIDRIASVASFFVSRVDTAVDKLLAQRPEHAHLLGTAAVANAKVAYERFERLFASPRFARLRDKGARIQRVLWASTSTKNPAYPDLKYVEPLIGPHTINTVPPATLEAILDHATVRLSIRDGREEAHAQLAALAAAGIDLKAVTKQLEDEGVAAFARSYEELLATIGQKAGELAAARGA